MMGYADIEANMSSARFWADTESCWDLLRLFKDYLVILGFLWLLLVMISLYLFASSQAVGPNDEEKVHPTPSSGCSNSRTPVWCGSSRRERGKSL